MDPEYFQHPGKYRDEITQEFLDFATEKLKGRVWPVSEIAELAEIFLFNKPDFELDVIYRDNSDNYDYEDDLEDAESNLGATIDEVVKSYLMNPKDNPQVIIALFRTWDDSKYYNILTYFWIDGAASRFSAIRSDMRIDVYESKIDVDNMSKAHNTSQWIEFWGFTPGELEAEEGNCQIMLLSLNIIPLVSSNQTLNWIQFPESLVR
ncbi:hypothetical protein N9M03_00080 [bacterium]|nr:hypothetical protein [bacterium]